MFLKFFKSISAPPSASQIAQRDLAEAERQLLATQAQAEHAAKMVEYYQNLVDRLRQYNK